MEVEMATAGGRTSVAGVPTAYPEEGAAYETHEAWLTRTRVVLSPVAAPSILGLFGFFVGTIMVGTNLAGWWGNAKSPMVLFPFALVAGGIAQFLAGMWSYKARDGLATAMHGIWGSFWIAYGILYFLIVTHTLTATPLTSSNPMFAMWFVALAAVTGMGALASLAESIGLFTVLSTLAVGSGFFAAGLWSGSVTTDRVAGWLFVISAAAAWYVASAMMMLGTTGRTLLPLGKWSRSANVPLRSPVRPIGYEVGEPGVRHGQ
jgi:succinate-acetate transporter protein